LQGLRAQLDDQWCARLTDNVQTAYEGLFPRQSDYRSSASKFLKHVASVVPATQIAVYTLHPSAGEYRADHTAAQGELPPANATAVNAELQFGTSCHTSSLAEAGRLVNLLRTSSTENSVAMVTTSVLDAIPSFVYF